MVATALAAVTSHCPVQGGWRRGGGERPPPCHPCISLSPPLPVPELSSSTWSESSVAPSRFPGAEPHSGQMGGGEAGGGLPTGHGQCRGVPSGREAPPQQPGTGSPGDCQYRNHSRQVQESWGRTEVGLGLSRASRPPRERLSCTEVRQVPECPWLAPRTDAGGTSPAVLCPPSAQSLCAIALDNHAKHRTGRRLSSLQLKELVGLGDCPDRTRR